MKAASGYSTGMKKGILTLFFPLLLVCASPVQAYDPDRDHTLAQSERVLNEIMSGPTPIPKQVLAKARAIAIYPSIVKGGLVVAVRYGKGVVMSRDEKTGKWSAPAFSIIRGASLGFQIGVQATDVVLVILNDKGFNGFLSNRFTLGGDVTVLAGTVHNEAEFSADPFAFNAEILSYSHSRGFFGGLALNGALVSANDDSSSDYYGKRLTASEILTKGVDSVPDSSRQLMDALQNFSSGD